MKRSGILRRRRGVASGKPARPPRNLISLRRPRSLYRLFEPPMETSDRRPGPPDSVALVARTHWVVGGVILVSIGLLRWIVEKYPVEFSVRTYAITGGLAALYGLAGTLVWF